MLILENGNKNDLIKIETEHQIEVSKQRQNLLLMLCHSSKCKNLNENCKNNTLCLEMKKLWEHIRICNSNICELKLCIPTKTVLSHYIKCKDQSCHLCGPTRNMVRANAETSSNSNVGTGTANASSISSSTGTKHKSQYSQSQGI